MVLWGTPKNGLKFGKLCLYGHMNGAVREVHKITKMKNAERKLEGLLYLQVNMVQHPTRLQNLGMQKL